MLIGHTRPIDSVVTPTLPRLSSAESLPPPKRTAKASGLKQTALSPWWVRVGLVNQRPLHRLDLGENVICRSRSGTQQRWTQHQLKTGLNKGKLPALRCVGGWIHLNGVAYWGPLELERIDQEWLAIHTVELERYVASVVGAEMPSAWHTQALQAQAVAASSYALTHLIRPATARYHLGDSTRWQVYRGATSRSAAAERATRATHGIILSKGQAVVESLYASTKEISESAHHHLGASMSQFGARELAEQGLSYSEILSHFYPGTQLKQLRRADG